MIRSPRHTRHSPPTGRPNGRPMTGSGGRSSIPRSPSSTRTLRITGYPAFAGYDGRRGYDGQRLNAGYARIQIIPIGIDLLNQPDFPGSIPLLQLFFAPDRVFGIIELFE